MRIIHGYMRTKSSKIWYSICWWDGAPMDIPMAA